MADDQDKKSDQPIAGSTQSTDDSSQTEEESGETKEDESSQPSEPSEPSEQMEASSTVENSDGERKTSEKPSKEEKRKINVTPALAKIIEQIEKLSVLELADLVHALEEKFGVSATPTVVAGAAAPATGETSEQAEEQTTFNVILADGGANKIGVIKAVREIVPTLGLTDAKALVDSAPKPVLEGVGKDAAGEAKTKLEAAGAKVELQ